MATKIDAEAIRQRSRDRYFETGRDKLLMQFIGKLRQNAKDIERGKGSHRRSLFVIGGTGSGKTRSIKHHLPLIDEWRPFENQYGDQVTPLICIKPPKPCSMRALAVELLTAMRVPAKGRKTEQELYVFLKEQLKERGVKAIWIDEMQDVLRNNTPKAIQAVQDILKALVQIEEWPIHTIYSGVPALSAFLQGDLQLARRSYVMRYEPMEYPDDAEWLERITAGVVEEDCGMTRADDMLTEVFLEKLCRAASGAFGSVIEMVQEACFRAADKGRRQVKLSDFSKVYEEMTGCMRRDNVFVAANWLEIVPANALYDLAPPAKSRRAA
ncbi:ATP-binding protein [Pseudaminobacter soli (ex Li et al. 2025)]|uniref:Transposase n=1 Tax=Pseudaminobacter soli (ex Li et al. 2025) TaxID=1295366 RepID=A0A2P7SGL6_9HYPH|nr:ATP-binding protein [Mesorhizobium soli]PSJ61634.1 transposase [Mesorhizobium soli]